MSDKTSSSWHVYYNVELGNITAFLKPLNGDIWQNYKNPSDWVNDSNYTPQFSNDNPRIIELVLNATGADELAVASAQWFYNGIDCTTQPAYFETSIINNTKAQLKIKGNIGKLTHNQSVDIRCKANVGATGSVVTTKVNVSCPVTIRQQTQDTYRATIVATNPEANFTIGADGSPVGLQCLVYDWQFNQISDPGLSYAWTKLKIQGGLKVWDPIGSDSDTINVGASDINNQAKVRCEVSLAGSIIAADTQTVYDTHDPWIVVARFDPEDCTIRNGVPGHNVINVYIDIQRSSDGARATRADLTFMLLDTVGNEIQDYDGRRWQNIRWVASDPQTGEISKDTIAFTITPDDFANGGRELVLALEGDVE